MSLSDLRQIYGSVFLTEVSDGQNIPWKPLSIGEFQKYEILLQDKDPGIKAVVEDEIFRSCVLDQVVVSNLDKQKAGTITTVVAAIMSISGPSTPEEFNNFLNYNRQIASLVINEAVISICWAFPGYTPEDVLSLDYSTFMLRLAMAEKKLMSSGIYTKPFELINTQQEQLAPKKPKYDPAALAQAFKEQSKPEQKPQVRSAKNMVEAENLDLGTAENGQEFVVSTNMMAAALEVGDDNDVKRMKMDANQIYSDYLEQSKRGKVKIKSYEERVKEAQDRADKNAQRLSKRK